MIRGRLRPRSLGLPRGGNPVRPAGTTASHHLEVLRSPSDDGLLLLGLPTDPSSRRACGNDPRPPGGSSSTSGGAFACPHGALVSGCQPHPRPGQRLILTCLFYDDKILGLWDRIDAFQPVGRDAAARVGVQLLRRPALPHRQPPTTATCSPATIKDIVPRYWTMRGYRWSAVSGGTPTASRRDGGGERSSDLSGPKDIAAYGIERFNEACRAVVQATTENWKHHHPEARSLGRLRRRLQDHGPRFMESGVVGLQPALGPGPDLPSFKVLPYSWGAATPLSNFEANLDYQDVDDPAITVRLGVVSGRRPGGAGRLAAHLDDDTLDPSGKPRGRVGPGDRLRRRGRDDGERRLVRGRHLAAAATAKPTARPRRALKGASWSAPDTSRPSTISAKRDGALSG